MGKIPEDRWDLDEKVWRIPRCESNIRLIKNILLKIKIQELEKQQMSLEQIIYKLEKDMNTHN